MDTADAAGNAPLPPELAPLVVADPRELGPYRVVGRLGAGGMGPVYGALDGGNRCVAVKVVHSRYADRGDYRQRFAAEIGLVLRIDAECAPAFLGADPQGATPWLATEFVPGRTLRAHVGEFGPLSGEALLSFAAGTAEALAAVHSGGVLHRDVQPANVILSPSGPRVLDFGIARAVEDTTPEPGAFGTPGWLAPEQMAREAASTRSDVFVWGGLVVYAATGHGPYGNGDTQTLLARMRTGAIDAEGVPEVLRPLIGRALSPDPADRPEAAEAFGAVLALSSAEGMASGAPRERLRQLLETVWWGFDAAGHRPESWVAAGGAAVILGEMAGVGSAAGATAAGAGPVAGATTGAAATGAGTIAGMSKATALLVAVTTATAVTTGGWVAGRIATDQPIIPGLVSTASPSPSASLTQEVKFRNMTLRIPQAWGHRVMEPSDLAEEGGFDQPRDEKWLVLFPEGGENCEDVDSLWSSGSDACRYVAVYGPAGLEYGGAGYGEITEEDDHAVFMPRGDPPSCPGGRENYGEEDPRYSERPRVAKTVPAGDREALYREVSVACYSQAANPTPGGTTDWRYFDQYTWLLPVSEIIVVDNWGIDGIGDILAGAEMAEPRN